MVNYRFFDMATKDSCMTRSSRRDWKWWILFALTVVANLSEAERSEEHLFLPQDDTAAPYDACYCCIFMK